MLTLHVGPLIEKESEWVCVLKITVQSIPLSKLSCSLLGWSFLSSFCRNGKECWWWNKYLQSSFLPVVAFNWSKINRNKIRSEIRTCSKILFPYSFWNKHDCHLLIWFSPAGCSLHCHWLLSSHKASPEISSHCLSNLGSTEQRTEVMS